MGMRASVVDFLRHSSGVPIVGPWLERTNQGPVRHWHTHRPGYPLLGCVPALPNSVWPGTEYFTTINEPITEVEASQIGVV